MSSPEYTPKHVRFDGKSWPRADVLTNELSWQLRYDQGRLSSEDIRFASEVVKAYVDLVHAPVSVRARIIAVLLAAEKALPVQVGDE